MYPKFQTNKKLSDELRAVYTPLIDRKECRERYSDTTMTITDNMFCAGNGITDSCKGIFYLYYFPISETMVKIPKKSTHVKLRRVIYEL